LALNHADSSNSRGQAAIQRGLSFGFSFVLSRRDEISASARPTAGSAAPRLS
jgi:hypothetical protein